MPNKSKEIFFSCDILYVFNSLKKKFQSTVFRDSLSFIRTNSSNISEFCANLHNETKSQPLKAMWGKLYILYYLV